MRRIKSDAGMREGVGVFFLFLSIYVLTRSQYFTGDTFYYAHQVDTWILYKQRIYWFFHPAHVLVVPIAVLFSLLLKTIFHRDTLMAMGVMAAAFGAGLLSFFHALLRRIGISFGNSLLLTSILGLSFGFWDYGTVGEDRIQGLFFLMGFLFLFVSAWLKNEEDQAISISWSFSTGLFLGLAVGAHLSNALLFPFFGLSLLFLFGKSFYKKAFFWIPLLAGSLTALSCYLFVALGNENKIHSLKRFLAVVFRYHSKDQPYFTIPHDLASLFDHFLKSGIGVFTVFYHIPEVYLRTVSQISSRLVLLILASILLAFGMSIIILLFRKRPNRLQISLFILLVFWSVHSFLFEPVSRANWLPVILVLLMCFAFSWEGSRRDIFSRRTKMRSSWSVIVFCIFLSILILNNAPHMIKFHKEKSAYLRFLEFSISHLPKGSLLIEGNSMAITYLDYFQDRYSYPFSVVSFVDLMEIRQAIFFRFKPPPIIITQIDDALAQGRPVFITERTIRISENQRKFLEMEYPQEAIDSFLKKYQISPCLDAPYSRIFQVYFNDDPYAD